MTEREQPLPPTVEMGRMRHVDVLVDVKPIPLEGPGSGNRDVRRGIYVEFTLRSDAKTNQSSTLIQGMNAAWEKWVEVHANQQSVVCEPSTSNTRCLQATILFQVFEVYKGCSYIAGALQREFQR